MAFKPWTNAPLIDRAEGMELKIRHLLQLVYLSNQCLHRLDQLFLC